MQRFSEQLKAWRVARGLSQKKLAELSGLPRPNLVDLELGRRDCTLKTLERLAQALGLRMGTLIDERPPAKSEWTRYEVDALARGLIEGSEELSDELRFAYECMEPLLYPLLRAAGVPGALKTGLNAGRIKRSKAHAEALLGRETVARVFSRVNKLLGMWV